MLITSVTSPVVDGFGRSFHQAVEGYVGTQRRSDQLIVHLDDRVDCTDQECVDYNIFNGDA